MGVWLPPPADFWETVIGLLGAAVAILLYRLNYHLRHDSWFRSLRDFHQIFWTDEACITVRAWLACDSSYEEVRAILAKRLAEVPLRPFEYAKLEQIDRFAALLAAYKEISPRIRKHRKIFVRLFESYWLGCLESENRGEIRQYFQRFFPELCMSPDQPPSEAEYREIASTFRHYSNLRFAVLTLASGATAGLLACAFGNALPNASADIRWYFRVAGVLATSCFLAVEICILNYIRELFQMGRMQPGSLFSHLSVKAPRARCFFRYIFAFYYVCILVFWVIVLFVATTEIS
jgi:hypothetical protein